MKGIICCFLLCLSSVSAFTLDFHEAKKEIPKPNELFMWVEVVGRPSPCERQTIYISHYRNSEHRSKIKKWGWFSFEMKDIEMMFEQGTQIHYIP